MEKIKEIIKNLTQKQKILIVIIATILLIIGFIFIYKYYYDGEENIIENGISKENAVENKIDENETISNTEKEEIQEEPGETKFGKIATEKTITVHVIGEVITPGVVTLKEGSRIIDAISAAGGKTENADLTKINLAYVLEDGTQIYVPRVGENLENKEVISEEAGEGVINESVTEAEEKNIKVNINTANSEKLQTLPGVGPAMASKIIEYRNSKGKFKTIEDLKNVSGIGDNKFNKLKDYIVVN